MTQERRTARRANAASTQKRSETARPAPRPVRRRRLGVAAGAFAILASAVVIAALAVLPVRTWMEQREERSEVEQERERLDAEVAQLQAELNLLETDAEIERRARESFDLVFPGEESYRILAPIED